MRKYTPTHFNSFFGCAVFGLLCITVLLPMKALGQQTVYYPRAESESDERASYPLALLRLCLQKSGSNIQLLPSPAHMQQSRSLRLLEQGKVVDVVWTVTSQAREDRLRAIHIPIDRGLIGWRLLLIREKDVPLFAAINNVDELAAVRAGQGHDWPDTDILRNNTFSIATSTTYEGLFTMLALGHIDYFPRSITEVWHEQQSHEPLHLSVENHLALHYPAALYFFVNKNNPSLATLIENGLRACIADGSMLELFNEFYRGDIERADFAHRKILTIPNTTLPVDTPLNVPEFWFTPHGKP